MAGSLEGVPVARRREEVKGSGVGERRRTAETDSGEQGEQEADGAEEVTEGRGGDGVRGKEGDAWVGTPAGQGSSGEVGVG
jgi:hypothetical protein